MFRLQSWDNSTDAFIYILIDDTVQFAKDRKGKNSRNESKGPISRDDDGEDKGLDNNSCSSLEYILVMGYCCSLCT